MGYADPKKVGLGGFSFSGYGSNYVAVRSKMFAAVFAGAGVSDLLSDFNHLWGYSPDRRLGAGVNAHRYNIHGQQRMGSNPHDDFELFKSQSPSTYVKDMECALLLLQGESDELVAWIEAVEFYNALRFNGKNVILLSYAKEPHGIYQQKNRYDLHQRTFDFFNHYLKGEPAADWIKNGVPFIDKKK